MADPSTKSVSRPTPTTAGLRAPSNPASAASPGGSLVGVSPEVPKAARLDFMWKVVGRFDAYISATLTRAALTVALNSLVVGSIVIKWSDLFGSSAAHPLATWIGAIGLMLATALSLASLICALFAVDPLLTTPRTLPGAHSRVFFADVAKFVSREEYKKAVVGASDEDLEEDLASQIFSLAGVLDSKFEHLRRASWTMIASLGLLAVAVAAKFFIILIGLIHRGHP